MRKVLLLVVGTAVLWLPAVSVAGDSSQSHDAKSDVSTPAATCKSRGSELNFANAFGKCVSAIAKHKDKSEAKDDDAKSHDEDRAERDDKDSSENHGEDRASPAMTCKAMRAHELAHFRTTYGRRPNAYGKCVSKQAHDKNG
jgi:hypothetical protein